MYRVSPARRAWPGEGASLDLPGQDQRMSSIEETGRYRPHLEREKGVRRALGRPMKTEPYADQ